MSDDLSPESMVSLPRLDAQSAAALGEALHTEGSHAKKLPASIAGALKPLGKTTETLHGALRGRLGTGAAAPSVARAADVTVDSAVAAFFDWQRALARLPEGVPEGDRAREWLRELFPDGLKFVKMPYAKEWAEIETRLTQLKSRGYDKEMQDCGGKPFLTFLQKAHKAYGEALGITAPLAAAEVKQTAALREALRAQLQAIRFYVLRVLSSIEPDDAATAEQASRLLRPLTQWKSRSAKAAETPAPTPTVPAAAPQQ